MVQLSDRHRQRISESMRSIWKTEAHRRKMSKVPNPMLGKHHSEEAKRKMSEAKRGENNPFFGKHHSEETKQKVSEALMGHEPWKGVGIGHGSYCDKGHWVRSSWERQRADWLFAQGIEYEYEPQQFDLGDGFRYRPDFYLPRLDVYEEIKGYTTPRDLEKWRRFRESGYNLVVLDSLEALGSVERGPIP